MREVWVDPGIGFGKTAEHNWTLLAQLDRVVALGWPVVVGASRKGFLGAALAKSDGIEGSVPVDDRREASLAVATWAMLHGARMVRAHEVRATAHTGASGRGMKGKWALGIPPRHFTWVLKNKLAICERPGGYAANHRRVRRQEEIIWIREQRFDCVISLITSPHNLHNYDELGVQWRHRPFNGPEDGPEVMLSILREIQDQLRQGKRLIVHRDELGDHVVGLMAGYLLLDRPRLERPGGRHRHRAPHAAPAGPRRARAGRAGASNSPPVRRPHPVTDLIEVRGLRVLALCGVLPEERVRAQPFEIDLDVEADLSTAGASDDLEDTIDYGRLCADVEKVATAEQFGLLERFAQRVAEVVLADPKVDAVTVWIHKMRPPVPQHLDSSGVRIRRTS